MTCTAQALGPTASCEIVSCPRLATVKTSPLSLPSQLELSPSPLIMLLSSASLHSVSLPGPSIFSCSVYHYQDNVGVLLHDYILTWLATLLGNAQK